MRLFAIAAVVVHHAIYDRWSGSLLLRVLGLQDGNGVGVPLFLILSGLLLTSILLNTSSVRNRYRNFLIRRCLRVFPLYYAYLFAAFLLTWQINGRVVHHLWIFAFFLQSNLLHASGETGSRLPLFHLWTLAIQEQFYLLWPLLVWRCSTLKQVRILCWTGILGSFCVRLSLAQWGESGQHLYMLLPARAGELCLGGLMAIEVREPTAFTRILKLCALPLGAIYIAWAWKGLNFGSPIGGTLGLLLVTAFCGAIISLGLDEGSWIYRLLGSAQIASVGRKYSYGIFVLHPAMLLVCFAAIRRGQWLRVPIEVLGTAFLVWAVHNFYELPFLQSATIAGLIRKTAFACPLCESSKVSRIPADRGIWSRVVLPSFGRCPWRCTECTAQFRGRPRNGIGV